MRKLLFALALCLLPTIAHAQNTTCSDRPQSDSSNACANTRFAHGAAAKFAPGGANGSVQYNNNGVFGGINPLDVPRGGTGQQTFTPNLPLIGNGINPIAQGTLSGNTTSFGTTSGVLPNGNCAKFDINGNLVDSGTACGSSSTTYDTVAALTAATVPATVNSVTTLGYYVKGDGGGTTYVRVASAPTLPCSQTSNAGTSFWDLQNRSITNVEWCGTKGDGTSDDTTAISNAITSVTALTGAVYIPCGSYNVTGTGSAVFTINGPIRIFGTDPSCTKIILNASIPTTRDLFHIVGGSGSQRGFFFDNFTIQPASTAVGRHMFHFDCTGGGIEMGQVSISHIYSAVFPIASSPFSPANAAGNVIYFDNTGSINANGCVFLASIENNILTAPASFNAIDCEQCGDSIYVSGNQFSGLGGALFLKQITGAGNWVMQNNNITSCSMMVISQAISFQFLHNVVEQLCTNTETNNSQLDLDGTALTIDNPVISDNQFQSNPSTGNPIAIRINNVTNARINGGRIATPAAYSPINITANAVNTQFDCKTRFAGVSSPYVNASPSTQILCSLISVSTGPINFNAVADTTMTFSIPTYRYTVSSINVYGCTAAITAAHFGVFTGAGATGTTILANTTGTVSTPNESTAGNYQVVSPTFTSSLALNTLFFRVITAQGSAVSCFADVVIFPLP